MGEEKWLTCDDPERMLEFLRGKATARKLRLFAVACCRRVEHMLVPDARAAVEVAEQFADGVASIGDRKAARARALDAGWVRPPEHPDELFAHARGSAKSCVCYALAGSRYQAALGASNTSRFSAVRFEYNRLRVAGLLSVDIGWREQEERLHQVQRAAHVALLRDIFGNPFHLPALDVDCLTPDVLALARAIYDDRAFSRMPELAGALGAAGCDDADVLAHCRAAREHVRGCWVLDLVLGKS